MEIGREKRTGCGGSRGLGAFERLLRKRGNGICEVTLLRVAGLTRCRTSTIK